MAEARKELFHSKNLLKEPLRSIWIAALFEIKLNKEQVCRTNISSVVDKIIEAEDTIINYRILGHLLLGIVKIYSKKVDHLDYDYGCLLSKLQQLFGRCRGSTSSIFDPSSTIIIPNTLELDAFHLDIEVDESRNYISNMEKITIHEQTEEVELQSLYRLYCLEEDASDFGYHLPDLTLVEAVCFGDTMTVDSLEDFLPSDEADEQQLMDEDKFESPNCSNGTPHLKVPHVAGAITPMLAVQTPATKEGVVVKKFKCKLDEGSTIISNKRLKEQIESTDLSHLKRKRRTRSSAKCFYRANQIRHKNLFSTAVIPCSSLNNIFNLNDKLPKDPEQIECLVTPANSFEDNAPSMSEDQEFDMNLVNEDLNSLEDNQENYDNWSVRTRSVASLLQKNFRSIKYREEGEALKMSHISAGKTQRESAILFYELLVLKTEGYVNVRQDDAYGDISVGETSKLKKLKL